MKMNGGQCRARTCDLLLVRRIRGTPTDYCGCLQTMPISHLCAFRRTTKCCLLLPFSARVPGIFPGMAGGWLRLFDLRVPPKAPTDFSLFDLKKIKTKASQKPAEPVNSTTMPWRKQAREFMAQIVSMFDLYSTRG